MSSWELPVSLNVGGKEYAIRTDYRVVLDILSAMNDPDIYEPGMTEEEKKQEQIMTMLQILYEDFYEIPSSDWKEAAEKACDFIDCGMSDNKPKPKIMDWQQDAPLIVPAVNKVYGSEIRAEKYMHWWTFMGLYMEIGQSTYATVISIREKKRKSEKLDKWEQDFYKNNRNLIDLKNKVSERSEEEMVELRELFGLNK